MTFEYNLPTNVGAPTLFTHFIIYSFLFCDGILYVYLAICLEIFYYIWLFHLQRNNQRQSIQRWHGAESLRRNRSFAKASCSVEKTQRQCDD